MTSLTNHYTDQVRLGQVRIGQAIFSQVRLGQASNVYVVFSGVCQRNLYHLVGSVQHLVSCVIRIPNLNGIISITQLVLCSTQYSLLQVYFGEYRSLYILMSTVFCMVQLMKLYDLVWDQALECWSLVLLVHMAFKILQNYTAQRKKLICAPRMLCNQ